MKVFIEKKEFGKVILSKVYIRCLILSSLSVSLKKSSQLMMSKPRLRLVHRHRFNGSRKKKKNGKRVYNA